MTNNRSLGQRATACADWKWLPGMAFFDEHGAQWRVQSETHATYVHDDRVPDLTDPATMGCLLALVRELWGKPVVKGKSPIVCATECYGMWEFGYRYGEVRVSCMWGQSEAEVLVWALENGP